MRGLKTIRAVRTHAKAPGTLAKALGALALALACSACSQSPFSDESMHLRLWEDHFRDGNRYLKAKRYSEAKEKLEEARNDLQHIGGNASIRALTSTRLAEAYQFNDQIADAQSELSAAVGTLQREFDSSPGNTSVRLSLVNALNSLAGIYHQQKNDEKAVETYKMSLALCGKTSFDTASLARAQETASKSLTALPPSDNNRGPASTPQPAPSDPRLTDLYVRGHNELKSKHPFESVKLLEQALEISHHQPMADLVLRSAILIDLTDGYQSLQQVDKAAVVTGELSELNAAEMGKNTPAALERLELSADFLSKSGKLKEAEKRYRTALAAQSNLKDKSDSVRTIDLKRKLAQVMIKQGRTAEGVQALSEFVRLSGGKLTPKNPTAGQQLLEITEAFASAGLIGDETLAKLLTEYCSGQQGQEQHGQGQHPAAGTDGDDDPTMQTLISHAAACLTARKQYAAGITYQKRHIASVEREQGPRSETLVPALEYLSAQYVWDGHPEQGIAPLKRSMAILKTLPPTPEHRRHLAKQHDAMTNVYMVLHDNPQTRIWSERTMALTKLDPALSLTGANALGAHAGTVAAAMKHDEALKEFKQCLSEFDTNLPKHKNDPDYPDYRARRDMFQSVYTNYKKLLGK